MINYMLLILISLGFQEYTPPKIEIKPIIEQKIEEVITQEIEESKPIEQMQEEKPSDEIIKTDYGYYKRWNEQYKCYDESEYPSFESVHNILDDYDPNWLECTKSNNGCVFCFHPIQGIGNSLPDKKGE